jgi:hypothetical protein
MKNKILIFRIKKYPDFELTWLQCDFLKPSLQHFHQLFPIQISLAVKIDKRKISIILIN